MKRSDIEIGGRYTAKVSGQIVAVRIVSDLGTHWRTVYGQPSRDREVHSGWTAINVATICVPSTATHKIRAGRMDQNGPRVRVRKIVKCPATDNFKYMRV